MSLEIERRVTTLEADVVNLKGLQKSQSSSLERVEAKIDKLIFWFMTLFAGIVTATFVFMVKGA